MTATPATAVRITPIPAFRDNYLWLLDDGRRAAIVDPGDAGAVRRALAERRLELSAIVVTHHHADHVGGVAALAQSTGAAVYGPAGEDFDAGNATVERLREGDAIEVLGVPLQVLDVPGHTAGHIAYHAAGLQALFCGDTLFACGCGRLFEGTPAQMVGSLRKLAQLPAATRVYCAHEYTLSNLRFALAVEADNPALHARQQACLQLRERGQPTVPSTLGEELSTNPFLRLDAPAVLAAAARRQPGAEASAVQTFAAIRAWKDVFA
jgi:hydroxyacylglutathione hydrolase